MALRARDAGGPAIAAQITYYPVTDLTDAHYDSKDKFSDGYGLSQAAAQKFPQEHAANVTDCKDPYLSPLYAPTLAGLPAALMVTEGFDPLTDTAHGYERLKQSGVPITALY